MAEFAERFFKTIQDHSRPFKTVQERECKGITAFTIHKLRGNDGLVLASNQVVSPGAE